MAKTRKSLDLHPEFWAKAKRELSAFDPIMKKIIRKYRGEILKSRGSAFITLVRSIVGQQISVKAAESVWQRVVLAVPGLTPEAFLEMTAQNLRACGLSERKVQYIQDLSRHFNEGKIRPHHWQAVEDEEIIQELIQVKGIGRWTAEMFLIFHLLRPNVFPVDDLGLQKGLALAYGVKYPVSDRNLKKFRKQFSPWGSVATWYLWRTLDPIPVEY